MLQLRILILIGSLILIGLAASASSIWVSSNVAPGEELKDEQLEEIIALRQLAEPLFETSAQEFGVPADLLRAYAFVQTRWAVPDHNRHESCTHMPLPYGIMGLHDGQQGVFRNQVGRAARLLGITEDEVKTDLATNIRAAAA